MLTDSGNAFTADDNETEITQMRSTYTVEMLYSGRSEYVMDYTLATGAIEWTSNADDAMSFDDRDEAEVIYTLVCSQLVDGLHWAVSIEEHRKAA